MKNLGKRKILAAKVLGVGKGRIVFDSSRLTDIKEAITKQDIKDLYKEGIISIKPVKGRMKKKMRKTKRKAGKIKRKIRKSKQRYVKAVRKQRAYIKEMRSQGKISASEFIELAKKIKAGEFRDKFHLKEHLRGKEQ